MSIDAEHVEFERAYLSALAPASGNFWQQHGKCALLKLVFFALFASSMIVCAAPSGNPRPASTAPNAMSTAAADSNSQAIRPSAPKGVTEAFYACIDRADQNLTEVGICITNERDYQDARLNKVYKQLLQVLSGKSKENLIAAEKSWIAFKDKDGAFMATLYGTETVDNLELEQSKVFRLCERANALERYLFLAKD